MSKKNKKGVVYALSNPAFTGLLKIGMTKETVENRLKTLYTTSVPHFFECEYAIEVDNFDEVETLLHKTFNHVRVNPKREFFRVDLESVKAAMKLTGGKDVTPKKNDSTADKVEIKAYNRAVVISERIARRKFIEADVSVNDELQYSEDNSITAKVANVEKSTIHFEGKEMALSRAAGILMERSGRSKEVSGWQFWLKDGESMEARVDKTRSDNANDE